MALVRTFRDLIAWQKAMKLAELIYQATKGMPESERFGLTNQMRRAAVSVPSNIAEGHARQSRADYLKHLRIARGSLAEVSTQYELATNLQMISRRAPLIEAITETDRILQALIRGLERKNQPLTE
jgi:four helix bundle protein